MSQPKGSLALANELPKDTVASARHGLGLICRVYNVSLQDLINPDSQEAAPEFQGMIPAAQGQLQGH